MAFDIRRMVRKIVRKKAEKEDELEVVLKKMNREGRFERERRVRMQVREFGILLDGKR
jgi:hypothetical protein